MKKAIVLHIGLTKVSGAPETLVNALNEYTVYESFFFNISSNEITFSRGKRYLNINSKVQRIIDEADVIHLHQVVPLFMEDPKFDLTDFVKSGKPIVRQWHSEPGHYSRWGYPDVEEFLNESFPHLVLTQYHERYYPWAICVPNLVNTESLSKIPTVWPEIPILAYSPSNRFSIAERRWASKGFYELLKALKPLVDERQLEIDIIENVTFDEVLKRKAKATFVVDEVVTGSYHLSGLEGLALGKPTFAYLDSRTTSILALTTGSVDIPFINCNINDIETVVRHFINNKSLIMDVGEYSRKWMETYYLDEILIKKYVGIYDDLLAGKKIMNPKKKLSKCAESFLKNGLIDLIHRRNNEI